jgi:hypothetical protein
MPEHGLLGVKRASSHAGTRPIKRKNAPNQVKTGDHCPVFGNASSITHLSGFRIACTAYQAQNLGFLQEGIVCDSGSPGRVLARPIRRTTHGLSGARCPGLSGARTRPIRRTSAAILVRIQRHIGQLTV